MRRPVLFVAALLAIVSTTALACRYTVRDIGFIDIAGPTYTLRLSAGARDAERVRALTALAEAHTDLANVRFDPVTTDTQGPSFSLIGPGGRSFDLGPAKDQQEAQALLETALASPARDALLDAAITSFATLLVIEGEDASRNAHAHASADAAIERIRALEPSLPRPLAGPIHTLTLASADRAGERVLMWSLGAEGADSAEPILAVLYGRLKLAGPVLVGAAISSDAALAQLGLVGESCECEASRDWVNEPAIPHVWSDQRRLTAARALGFDPDSPMVITEAIRIIERGVFTQGATPDPRRVTDDASSLFLGYSEFEIGQQRSANAPEVARNADEAPTQIVTTPSTPATADAPAVPETSLTAAAPSTPLPVGTNADDRTHSVALTPLLATVGVAVLVSIIIAGVILTRGAPA